MSTGGKKQKEGGGGKKGKTKKIEKLKKGILVREILLIGPTMIYCLHYL